MFEIPIEDGDPRWPGPSLPPAGGWIPIPRREFSAGAVLARYWGRRLTPSSPHGAPEPRAVVSWEGPGEPIMLTLYGPDGEVAVPLAPKRALVLAQELLTRGVQAIKADSWDVMYETRRNGLRTWGRRLHHEYGCELF